MCTGSVATCQHMACVLTAPHACRLTPTPLPGHNCLQDIGKPLWRMFRDASGRLVDVEALGSTLGKASRHVVRGLACCYCPGATFDLHFT